MKNELQNKSTQELKRLLIVLGRSVPHRQRAIDNVFEELFRRRRGYVKKDK